MIRRISSVDRLLLTSLLAAAAHLVHRFADQWGQLSTDAAAKAFHGNHLVYFDGVAVGEEPDGEDRTCWPVITATALGRFAAARHALMYTTIQAGAAAGTTRALGYQLPTRALAASSAVTLLTHYAIDRRRPLFRLAAAARKTSYIERATVVRKPGAQADTSGPGTALLELDQALHELFLIPAAGLAAALAIGRERSAT